MTQDIIADKAHYESLWSGTWKAMHSIGPLTRTRYRLIMEAIAPFAGRAQTVLDVGCGDGRLLAAICLAYPHLSATGLDFAEAAFENAPFSIRPYLRLADLEKPVLLEARYDLVICSEVLEHIDAYGVVLKTLIDSCAHSGIIVITVPQGMQHWGRSDIYAGHLRRFEFQAFREELLHLGLELLSYRTWGSAIGRIYFNLTHNMNQSVLQRKSVIRAAIASVLYNAMKLDDFNHGNAWHQLVVVARNP